MLRMIAGSAWLYPVAALLGAIMLVWWQRRQERARVRAMTKLTATLRTPIPPAREAAARDHPPVGVSSGSFVAIPDPLVATHSANPVAGVPPTRRSVSRHAPYVPGAALPRGVAALPVFGCGPRGFARTLCACGDEEYDLQVLDYVASEDRLDEAAACTIVLVRSRTMHHGERIDSLDGSSRATLHPDLTEYLDRDGLAMQAAGSLLAVFHPQEILPDEAVDQIVRDARWIHDLLATGMHHGRITMPDLVAIRESA